MNGSEVDLQVWSSDQLDQDLRSALRGLWAVAFDDFSPEDEQHAYGGTHVLALDGEEVVGHASVVPRTLYVGERSRELRTGYVEGVAVSPARQRTGLGTQVMAALHPVIRQRYELGALGTGSHSFYERLGWERWRGPTYVVSGEGRTRSPEDDDGVMVLRFGPSADLDLIAPIACEDRPGDAW